MDEHLGRTKRAMAALRRFDSGERLVALARAGRQRLPGDHEYGDPLSLTGDEAPQVVGRDRLDPEQIATRRRWRFKSKGAPKGLQAFVAERSG